MHASPMTATTVSIAMPPEVAAAIDERVAAGGYGNRSEYIRDLVRRDLREAAKDRLRALLAEGAASPPFRRLTDDDWDRLSDIATGKIE